MASTSLKYIKLFKKLLPTGWAWISKDIEGTFLNKLIKSLSVEPCRIEEAGFSFANDVFPDTTVDLLEDWERLLGLPDDCDPGDDKTIQERRDRVIQVLTTTGGQNAEFFKQLAANFGFDPNIIDVDNVYDFRAGRAVAGDAITNGDWVHVFIITTPTGTEVRFVAGSTAGERLLRVNDETLECLFLKHKPAHSIVLFRFK